MEEHETRIRVEGQSNQRKILLTSLAPQRISGWASSEPMTSILPKYYIGHITFLLSLNAVHSLPAASIADTVA
jgi:hypothetical protein